MRRVAMAAKKLEAFDQFRRHARALLRVVYTVHKLCVELGREPYTREVLRALRMWGYGHKMLKLAESLGLIRRVEGRIELNGGTYRCVFNFVVGNGYMFLRVVDLGEETGGEDEDDVLVAHLRADVFDGLVDVAAHRPFASAAADFVHEIADDLFALGRVDDFGMKLQAKELASAMLDRGVRGIFRDGDSLETGGQLRKFVAVGVPNLQALGQSAEERAAAVFHAQHALAVLAFVAALDSAAEVFGHDLQPVADAQHRDAEVKNFLNTQHFFF